MTAIIFLDQIKIELSNYVKIKLWGGEERERSKNFFGQRGRVGSGLGNKGRR